MRIRKRTFTLLMTLFAVSGLALVTRMPEKEPLLSGQYWSALFDVGQLMRLMQVENNSGQEVDFNRLGEAATSGMLQTLNDPYAQRLNRDAYEDFLRDTSQQYVGIGIELQLTEEGVVVSRVFPNSPAEASGVLPGDRIAEAGRTSLLEAGLQETVSQLRGPEGSSVWVRLFREGTILEPRLIQRRAVVATTVRDIELLPGGVGYARITSFGERTGEELQTALAELETLGMSSFVLDLRDNPGGLLTAAVDVAGLFLDPGELVVRTQSRRSGREVAYNADFHPPRDYPVAVLINQRSASASEVVAGALQDTDRAVIVGERSVGKGTVQSIYSLPDGTGFRQTTAIYLTPSGRSLDGEGIQPDIEIPVDIETYRQLLLQRQNARFLSSSESPPTFRPVLEDPQLKAAREAVLSQPS